MDNSSYAAGGSALAWLLAVFFGKKALMDRDKRLEDSEEWQRQHEKNHPNISEILRMHTENRALLSELLNGQKENRENHDADFRHLNSRIDRIQEAGNGRR